MTEDDDAMVSHADMTMGAPLATSEAGTPAVATDDAWADGQSQRAWEALARARVVMVDDDPMMIAVVQTYLEEAGYQNFTGIDDPTAAIRTIRRDQPDVLLLDLMMPQVDGFDILAAVRADPRTRFMPVIVMTSASDAPTKLKVLELGATDFLEKPVDASELALRLRNSLAFKAYRDRLEYFDPLTSLPNRRHLLERLSERLQAVIRDTDLLARVSLQRGRANGRLARVEQDTFALLLTGLRGVEDAAIVARRIHLALAQPFDLDGTELYLSSAIGIAGSIGDPAELVDAQSLYQQAGTAAAQALGRGRNAIAFYARELDDTARDVLTIESQLRRAVERREFVLFYQPKMDIASGRLCGCEALIRWQHPSRGLLGPGWFIQIAESSDVIIDIGRWVIDEACRQAAAWQLAGIPLAVSVNLSSMQLRDENILQDVRQALDLTRLDPRRLTVELTESSLMQDFEQGRKTLAGLQALGLGISLDDFGTGFSSLSYLKRMPLNELKLDKSFIDDIPHDTQAAAIVSAIISMAHTLNLTVVAEGVERRDQLEFLTEHGCDICQGYWYSKPLPASAIGQLLAKAVREGRIL
ncbi:MAG: EAL domain-containing protein [Burkholderiaceae bacterium]